MPANDEEPNVYLVLTRYKGHPDSHLVEVPPGKDVDEICKRKNIRGVDMVYPPGEWDYDPETSSPKPLD